MDYPAVRVPPHAGLQTSTDAHRKAASCRKVLRARWFRRAAPAPVPENAALKKVPASSLGRGAPAWVSSSGPSTVSVHTAYSGWFHSSIPPRLRDHICYKQIADLSWMSTSSRELRSRENVSPRVIILWASSPIKQRLLAARRPLPR